MNNHEALIEAADFLDTKNAIIHSDQADEIAATLRRIAADYEITESCGDVFEDMGITKPIEVASGLEALANAHPGARFVWPGGCMTFGTTMSFPMGTTGNGK